jgi:ribonuclease PH
MRFDGRAPTELRPFRFQTGFTRYAEGSVLIQCGQTHVLCNASVEPTVPKWLQGTGQGWISAEYSMLPRSTHERIGRDKGARSGRSLEISRLIGRSLRAAVNLSDLGERQITVDCDVLQADGGTRTTAITGGFVALALALHTLVERGQLSTYPIVTQVAAISAGLSEKGPILDLDYVEDSNIGTDMNFVMNSKLEIIEIQGTAEEGSFTRQELSAMLDLAENGCKEIFALQREALKSFEGIRLP